MRKVFSALILVLIVASVGVVAETPGSGTVVPELMVSNLDSAAHLQVIHNKDPWLGAVEMIAAATDSYFSEVAQHSTSTSTFGVVLTANRSLARARGKTTAATQRTRAVCST